MNAMLSEALRDFTGLLKQLLTNLLGNDADTWGNELRKFLRKEPCWTNSDADKLIERTFVTWKIPPVNWGLPGELPDVIRGADFVLTKGAADILAITPISFPQKTFELLRVTPKELEMDGMSGFPGIRARALQQGLELLPAEVAPLFLLGYGHRLPEDTVYIGMDPIRSSRGQSKIFAVSRSAKGIVKLGVVAGGHTTYFGQECVFVFGRRTKA
jgi:hypothetical protein